MPAGSGRSIVGGVPTYRSDGFERGRVAIEDPAALDVDDVYRRHFDDVHRWVRHLVGPDPDAEDLVQEVFAIVCRRLHTYDGRSALTTWLFGVARNVVRNHHRKQRVRKIFLRSDMNDAMEAADPTSPLEELERRRRERALYEILAALPEKYRTVIVLFELEGLDVPHIAERLGVREATVYVQLHRARKMFVERIQRRRM